jgi:hypothetical protein
MSQNGKLIGRGALTAPLCTLAMVLAIPVIAGDASVHIPRHLIDGSAPRSVPQVLRAQGGGFVMTTVRVVKVNELRRLTSTCVPGERLSAEAPVVERVGVNGRDITFLAPGSSIEGCDRNPHARAVRRPWCGGAGWILLHRKVSDPRLDICRDRRGRAVVAFGWINPVARARWVVVDQPGFREVYAVAAGLPVRVSTVALIATVRGTVFRTAQYDSRGVLLVRRTITAEIAS